MLCIDSRSASDGVERVCGGQDLPISEFAVVLSDVVNVDDQATPVRPFHLLDQVLVVRLLGPDRDVEVEEVNEAVGERVSLPAGRV